MPSATSRRMRRSTSSTAKASTPSGRGSVSEIRIFENPAMPTTGQIHLLSLAILLFAASLGLSIARLRWDQNPLRLAAKACAWSGVVATVAVLVWHCLSRATGSWLPLEDNFETFVALAALLALFVLYVQRTRPLGGLDWFVTP